MNSISLKILGSLLVLTTLFFSIECSSTPPAPLPTQEVMEDFAKLVCKQTKYYDICMTMFSDSRKFMRDLQSLVKIVIEKELDVAKEVLDALRNLVIDKSKSKYVRENSRKCFREYKAIVSTLIPNAIKALESGDSGHDSVIQTLTNIANYEKACDDRFAKVGEKVPFVNLNLNDLSKLALDFFKLLN